MRRKYGKKRRSSRRSHSRGRKRSKRYRSYRMDRGGIRL